MGAAQRIANAAALAESEWRGCSIGSSMPARRLSKAPAGLFAGSASSKRISLHWRGIFMRYQKFSALLRAGALLAASTALASTGAVAQTSAATTKAHLGTWGVDLTSRDLSVKPGEDFQKYASGTWLTKTDIPADKPEVGSFYEVFDLSQDQLKALVANADASSKYGAMYQSMMDEARAEQLGLAPLKPDLARVAAIKTKADFARHMGSTDGRFGSSIYAFDVEPDTADASMNVLYLYQSGLGLPNRDYYL